MGDIPRVKIHDAGRQVVETFGGINRALKIREGEWSEAVNLSSDQYPMLATRPRRFLIGSRTREVRDMLLKGGRLYTAEWDDSGYYLCGGTEDIELPRSSKRLVSMGAYIIVLGANIWYNTADGTHGSMEASFGAPETDITETGMTYPYVLKLCPCDEDGNELRIFADGIGDTDRITQAKADPAHVLLGIREGDCIAEGTSKRVWRYNGTASAEKPEMWTEISPVYLRIEADGIDSADFSAGDFVKLSGIPDPHLESLNIPEGVYYDDWDANGVDAEISLTNYNSRCGMYDDDPNGMREIALVGEGFLVVKNVFCTRRTTLSAAAAADFAIDRSMPDMDFVVEAQNRLWGCRYGKVNGEMINEIYASALGDFKNWRKYDGTSMASWAASVGTDGPWTGAITYNGAPYFFKENHMHRVYPSAYGAHQIRDYELDGIPQLNSNVLCVAQNRIYWRGHFGIYAYAGDTPVKISTAIDELLRGASLYTAAGANGKVFFTGGFPDNVSTKPFVLSYDIRHMIWHMESSEHALSNAVSDSAGPVAVSEAGTKKIWELLPSPYATHIVVEGEEPPAEWSCTSGLIGWADVEKKYVSRLVLRAVLAQGTQMNVWIEYDSDGKWVHAGGMRGTTGRTKSYLLPLIPKRCDHFRIKLEGSGEMALYSISKMYEKGSDVG